jgi:hypothetical protein
MKINNFKNWKSQIRRTVVTDAIHNRKICKKEKGRKVTKVTEGKDRRMDE